MELIKKQDSLVIIWEKKEVSFNDWIVMLDWLKLDFPWEYEKSWIMAHVIEKGWRMLFQIRFLDKIIWYINYDDLEIDEEIVDFFWNIDILLIKWSKNSIKTFENLEAKYVVPFWDQKDIFFSTLWQHPEVVDSIKIKELISENEVIFVNI